MAQHDRRQAGVVVQCKGPLQLPRVETRFGGEFEQLEVFTEFQAVDLRVVGAT